MPLVAGDKLGPYEILSLIGRGGMGEVYCARDPRLGRDVAIKVSTEKFSERFEREARVIASLNHPNICTLHDVGPNFLVMELVDGPTLADRIKEGPIPVEESLQLARQIADALEAAHEKGVVHRDLKPGNIKITPNGAVKVLDFGLALQYRDSDGTVPENSPTLSMRATQAGMILGTAAYMSPEQARGKPVDKRADIWAFGVVLYEMLSGRLMFQGEDISDTLAAVIRAEPQFDGVPPNMQRLLKSCLEKDPKRRLRDIGDVWRLLDEAPVAAPVAPVPAPSPSRLGKAAWAIAGVAVAVAAALAFVHFRENLPMMEVTRFQVSAPEKTNFAPPPPALSPDGRKLALVANGANSRRQLWVRSLDSLEARPLPGTEDTIGSVFWSPDSRAIAFTVPPPVQKLKRVEVAGGPAQSLCDISGPVLGAWSPQGVIIFGRSNGLTRVSQAGGACTPLTALDAKRGEQRHTAPSFLPDGKHFLYLRVSSKTEESGIFIGSLDAKPEQQNSQRLLAGTSGGVYAPSQDPSRGYLLFLREGTLMSQPFDPRRLALAGDAVPVAEQVGSANNGEVSFFSVSDSGSLAYRTGGAAGSNQLTWYDRAGKAMGTVAEPGAYNTLALSPDGTRVAFDRSDAQGNNVDIWVHEFARGTSTRFTVDPARDSTPVWSPDGSRIVFGSNRDGGINNLYQKDARGAGDEEALLKTGQPKFPQDWSPDGNFLLYANADPKTGLDLFVLPLKGERKAKLWLGTQFRESQARFSPDGRFIAYASNASGREEVYVRPFSPDGNASDLWTVSKDGGSQPLWRRDGKELFYISTDSKVMVVPVTTSPTFKAGIPEALFTAPILGGGGASNIHRWAVTPDGERFLINAVATETASTPITVVLNWQAGLKK